MLTKIFGSKDNKEEIDKDKLAEEERRKKLKRFMRKATLDEIRNPGMYRTLMRVRDIAEDGVQIKNSIDIEKWLNKLVYNRAQIIDIYCNKDKNIIKEYVVTYWEVVPPKDWESKIQNTIH
ncbi:hypothetical protein [Clostridium mediterraneense]|uniref:hypothetical protein n=1 Tax=Clostridium mediterraneense TaxID=1805472 RepID=UPI00082F3FA2|nr:hypothetical protein [Clostridium mediterraneense]